MDLNTGTMADTNKTTTDTKLEVMMTSLTELTELLLERERNNQPNIEHFSGNPTDYPLFIKLFDEHAAKFCLDNNEKLKLLIALCDGPAKDTIKYFALLDGDGYSEARETLCELYGRNDLIAQILLDGLTDGPQIPLHRGDMLMNLAVQMRQCELIINSLDSQSNIDKDEFLLKVMLRLPENLQIEWANIVERMIKEEKIAKFSDLYAYVKNCSRFATNYLGNIDLQKMRSKTTPATNRPKSTVILCPYCSHTDHALDECSSLATKDNKDKVKFMHRTRRCFNCLQIGHTARCCTARQRCSHCNGHHHDMFHREYFVSSFNRDHHEETQTAPTSLEPPASTDVTENKTETMDTIVHNHVEPRVQISECHDNNSHLMLEDDKATLTDTSKLQNTFCRQIPQIFIEVSNLSVMDIDEDLMDVYYTKAERMSRWFTENENLFSDVSGLNALIMLLWMMSMIGIHCNFCLWAGSISIMYYLNSKFKVIQACRPIYCLLPQQAVIYVIFCVENMRKRTEVCNRKVFHNMNLADIGLNIV